eukprot:SAG22_NODE_1247_length_5014_cov_14.420142_1_plen_434_part_00
MVPLLAAWFSCSFGSGSSPARVPYSEFRPGQVWLDTAGNAIRAHSGGLLFEPANNTTYWYGSDAYPMGDALSNTKINVYSSTDLYNWENRGVAFEIPADHASCAGPTSPSGENMSCYVDRCHVLRNQASGSYVMWCKSKPFVSVSVSKHPAGPFSLVGVFLPDGHEVGDCTVYSDPAVPADAYFVLSIHPSTYGFSRNETRQLRLYKLDRTWTGLAKSPSGAAGGGSVYTNITRPWPLPNRYDGKLEAPGVFRRPAPAAVAAGGGSASGAGAGGGHAEAAAGSDYFVWASHCTYWFPNDAYVLQAPSPAAGAGPGLAGSSTGQRFWAPVGNPTRNDSSFSTQNTHIFRIPPGMQGRLPARPDSAAAAAAATSGGKAAKAPPTHIYVSDRFEPYIAENTTGRYVWLPLTWDGGGAEGPGAGAQPRVEWHDWWQL